MCKRLFRRENKTKEKGEAGGSRNQVNLQMKGKLAFLRENLQKKKSYETLL
jgi:hypothetical protein